MQVSKQNSVECSASYFELLLLFPDVALSLSSVKILEKRHIMKENKAQYVKRERDLMSNLDHPFFVKLYFTFQDDEKLCILLRSKCLCVVHLII